MKKNILLLSFIFTVVLTCEGFSQWASDGLYFWNSTSISYAVNDKTELYLGNKDHFNNQIHRLDYFHFEIIGYRKIANHFSLGLGIRQTESYKSNQWNSGQSYMLYGVYKLNPWNMKIRFANRLVAKTFKTSETQYFLDNNTNVDFFTCSSSWLPKPFLKDEVFSNLDLGKIQTIRLYGGFHLFNKQHWGLDLYYCYWKTRSTAQWKDYNVLGLSTNVKI